jgi:hypothetical protein
VEQQEVNFVDENARMSYEDDVEMEEEFCSNDGALDHGGGDSGFASSLSRSATNFVSICSNLFTNTFGREDVVLVSFLFKPLNHIPMFQDSSTENLANDLSDHEKEAMSTLYHLEQLQKESPKRSVLQDVKNRLRNETPRKNSPAKRNRKFFDRKRSTCALYSSKNVSTISLQQQQVRRQRGNFLLEKRVPPQGIPLAAQPIRRIQSTSILESSFISLSPETVEVR